MARRKKSALENITAADAAAIVGHLRDAAESTKRAAGRLGASRSPIKALSEDKKLVAEIKEAQDSLAAIVATMAEKRPAKRRRRRIGPVKLLVAGTAVTFAACPWARRKLLDAMFGAEEEFTYSPPAPPSETFEAPGSPVASESSNGGEAVGEPVGSESDSAA